MMFLMLIYTILDQFSRGQEQHWWIGLNTYENDGRFRWSDSSLLNFISWAPGKPRLINKERKCVYMTASREDWGDQKCLTALPYICKRTNTTTVQPSLPSLPVPTPGSCVQGWHAFINKCFRINSQEKVTWLEAKRKCEVQGGILATISNHLEQAFITTLLPSVTVDIWIGLHDSKKEFLWIEPEAVKYVNWAPGEPSGYGTSIASDQPTNCVVMWHGLPSLFTGRWDDRNCLEEKHIFICQRSKDPTLNPSSTSFSPVPNSTLSYLNNTYRVLTKPLKWQEAVLLCQSLNGSLADVMEPYTQAFLTQTVSSLHTPLWIGLSSEEGRRNYVWFTDESISYTNWQDGEPQQIVGCAYMDIDGTWRTATCNTKLQGAICKLSTGPLSSHKWSYNGSCPKTVEDSSWLPFRNNCYAFHMEVMLGQKEAVKRCQKVGGMMLSILDEMENIFIWEHLQAYESQAKGAWLGMSFNSKGGTLVWHDSIAVNYSNWGQHDTGPSMISPNSCYWIQSSNGVWRLGSCSNVSMGVICKTARVEGSSISKSAFLENTKTIVVVILSSLALCALVAVAFYLYKRRWISERGTFESARYSRTNASPSESAEKNILVSDMEMNEQD
ncbi:C-type mannose receptor 2 [Python bivittatus]|uniref:C-type mannose receptor 2 n=1 Tax=Python bivittatus TaxID=176946 RepID=A0A9F2R1L7_PYTBI|nr:C-type mannose receptor 2 [Python bivittatus]